PVPHSYTTVNVKAESANPDSLLNWYKHLIQLRRSTPALQQGDMVMLDAGQPDVLSYLRKGQQGSASVISLMNISAQPLTITIDPSETGISSPTIKTLAASDPSLQSTTSLKSITLPPYSSWVASL